jgi:hypothetical protein
MKKIAKVITKAFNWYVERTNGYYWCPSGMVPMNYNK